MAYIRHELVATPPAHFVCHDLLVTSGARSSVQARSLAIAFTLSTMSHDSFHRYDAKQNVSMVLQGVNLWS